MRNNAEKSLGIKQKLIPGSIYEIVINEYLVYAQLLPCLNIAVFDKQFSERPSSFKELLSLPILCNVGVRTSVITKGQWQCVSELKIRKDLKRSPMMYIQDPVYTDFFRLYDPNNGRIYPCDKEDVEGLERCIVWEKQEIENRIKTHFLK